MLDTGLCLTFYVTNILFWLIKLLYQLLSQAHLFFVEKNFPGRLYWHSSDIRYHFMMLDFLEYKSPNKKIFCGQYHRRKYFSVIYSIISLKNIFHYKNVECYHRSESPLKIE